MFKLKLPTLDAIDIYTIISIIINTIKALISSFIILNKWGAPNPENKNKPF